MVGLRKGRLELVPRYWSLGPVSRLTDMERFFNELYPGLLPIEGGLTEERPRLAMVDLKDEKDRYVVRADLPGMAKEDVSIELDDQMVRISAFKESSTEEKEEGYLRRERGCMRFFRQVPIPNDVDRDNIKARMENGVLEVSLPKVQATEEQKTKIEVE